MKSEKLASLRSASDTRISGRVLATRLSGRLGTDAVPPDAQWSTDGLTDKKWASPYASGSRFLSVRVGAYCIRPIGRPRQGDEGGFLIVLLGDLLGSFGPCRARLWGVCNTPLRLRFSFFDRQGRGVWHTPYQTSPARGRMRVSGCVDGAFIGGVRALFFICHGVGASPHRPPHAYIYMYGEIVRALPFVCHGVGASPHRPPPPFLVLTQEKEAKEGQGYGHPS